MLINGSCHCGNITFDLDWRGAPNEIPARACSCTFCSKHGGVWTANANSQLTATIRDTTSLSKYTFGTKTAAFHICTTCGVVPLVTSEIAGGLYAVVNINTFNNVDPNHLRHASADFQGETAPARLARRQQGWIGQVHIPLSPPPTEAATDPRS